MLKDNPSELGRTFWQFEIAGVPLLPRLVTWGRFGEIEGEWWLKVWGERLLFCAASAPAKVFAVVTPCESETGLVAFWRAAIEREDWGEVTFFAQSLSPSGAGEAETGFVNIYSENKGVWTREWCAAACDGSWSKREGVSWESVQTWVANGEDWGSPSELEDEAVLAIGRRAFPAEQRQKQAQFWLRGSRNEWKRVLQACATVYFPASAIDEYGDPFPRGTRRFYSFAHTPFFVGWADGATEGGTWMLPPVWRDLFARHFVLIGWNWSRRHKFDETTRAGWKVKPTIVSAPIQLSLSPSQHELLEARLILRDWLRGKVPNEPIAELLR